MKEMPREIKETLRKYAKLMTKVSEMAAVVDDYFEQYGVPIENL